MLFECVGVVKEDSSVSPRCDVCFKQELMLFKCKYCGGNFCTEHRLPEKHACVGGYNTGGTWFGFHRNDTKTGTGGTAYPVVTKRNRLTSYKIESLLKNAVSYLFAGCYVMFFALPVGIALLVSTNLDPLSKIVLKSIVDQINLYALAYIISACYLLYQKVSKKETLKAYMIVAGVSFITTWLLMDKAAILYALNTLFGGSTKPFPNIIELYLLWVYVLVDKGLSLLTPIVQSYPPGRAFINSLRYWIAERARQIL